MKNRAWVFIPVSVMMILLFSACGRMTASDTGSSVSDTPSVSPEASPEASTSATPADASTKIEFTNALLADGSWST